MNPTCDPAELPEASFTDDPSEKETIGYCHSCGHSGEVKCEKCGSQRVTNDLHGDDKSKEAVKLVMERMRKIIIWIVEQKNSKFAGELVLLAFGDLHNQGIGTTETASKWNVTKAYVSKICVGICKYMHIEPPASMRGSDTKEAFRSNNRRPISLSFA